MARILVIEDDPTIRQLMVRLLTQVGYDVLDAFDGEDGIKQFQQNQIDLVITDWNMPRKNGGDVIREVRRQDPAAKIILVTAHRSEAEVVAAAQSVQKVLPKPFKLQDLLNSIEEVLGEDGSGQ